MSDETATPAAAEPLPSPDKTYDATGEARRLLRSIRVGALATLATEGPFASLVSLATRPDGSPIILVSQLSTHTRHLDADPRCSLLLAQGGKGDPLAHPRLTLVGRAVKAEGAFRAALRDRFLRRNPKAELYADFPDFSFWHIDVASAHLNGGFARAANFTWDAIATMTEDAGALLAAEEGAVTHMNQDHRDAIRLYAKTRGGAADADWRMTGLDPDGIDLAFGDRTLRLDFGERVLAPGDLRRILVRWAEEARQASPAAT